MQSLNLRHEEEQEVLVEVVEVASVPLIKIIGKLRLFNVVSGNAAVLGHDAESIAVEHDSENASHGLIVAINSGAIHLTGVGEGVVSTRTLPERNSLCADEFGVLIMESTGLEENIGRRTELRQHNDMLEILRSEPLLAALVEQRDMRVRRSTYRAIW